MIDLGVGTTWTHLESGRIVVIKFQCKMRQEDEEWRDAVCYVCENDEVHVRDIGTFLRKFTKE